MAYKDLTYVSKHTKEIRDQRRLEGLCSNCGFKSDTYRCKECRKKKKESKIKRSNLRKEKGLCSDCLNPVLKNKTTCLKHSLNITAKDTLADYKKWFLLEELMINQNFKCALTGIPIEWGGDIELDHILPLSRGGLKDILNVRWVTRRVNRMKYNYTDEEFKILIQKILLYLP